MRPSSPFNNTHLSKYSPSTRAADISRILDPSYSSSSSSSPQQYSATVYVDHHGDLHDPDYRDFPPLHPKRATASRSPSSSSYSPYATRPSWEFAEPYSPFDQRSFSDEGDQDEEEDAFYDTRSRSSRRSSNQRTPPLPRDYRAYPAYSYSPEPNLPRSFDSEKTFVHDDNESFSSDSKERKFIVKKSRTRSASNKSNNRNTTQTLFEEEEEEEDEQEPQQEWTPTCAESMVRQWQAISLRLRLGLFRAQRKVRGCVRGR